MARNPAVNNAEVPDPPHVVTASPSVGGPPQEDWNATSHVTLSGWATVDQNSGVADFTGEVVEPFPEGPGRWKQT